MRLLAILFFSCFLQFIAKGQNKFQYKLDSASSELLSTDPLSGKQHYKTLNTSLKKGQAAVFFMHSDAFRPYVLLYSQNFQQIGKAGIIDDRTAECWITAEEDTTFIVALTSSEENKTGKFSYGYKLMNPDQMVVDDNASFCERFAYLINHWALSWRLMPTKFGFIFDVDEMMEQNVPSEYQAAKYTLMGGKARVSNFYQETLMTDLDSSKIPMRDFYPKICKDIMNCLDKNLWASEEEEFKKTLSTKMGEREVNYDVTHFYLKGSGKTEHLKSFMIIFEWAPFFSVGHSAKVSLVFN